jgi:hypothetical protein
MWTNIKVKEQLIVRKDRAVNEQLTVRNDIHVNEHERLSNFTVGQILKQSSITFIAVLHFTITVGRCYSPGPPVSSTNKTDRHDITDITEINATSEPLV